jgi:trehalose 6-phosphate synthase/phosphatase
MIQKRLFIVSSRLPVQITAHEDDVHLTFSTDEMTSAIKGYLSNTGYSQKDFSEYYWVGVPGCTTGSWSRATGRMPESVFRCLPVFTNKTVYDSYYNGFCVSVLWPLFHYFPSHAEYNYDSFDNYIKINNDFFDVLNRHIRPNDVIWIHDYHLLPLAGIIRKAFPSITIGFFLHQPFPSFEIVRLLPKKWQEVIVKGMLGADLIGFQTIDYASHFIQSVQMILGLDNDMHVFLYDNRLIKVDVFPTSIDYQHLNDAFDDESISISRRLLKEKFTGKKIVFSIDRLDYTTGVQNRLKAYDHFLMNNPRYLEKVVFILVIAPFRESIPKNTDLKKTADETVRNINSKYGNASWKPIIYQCCNLNFEEKITFYTACDVALMAPLRDGMNLNSKEFVASRKDKKGILVLSETAGASRELTDALMVNPNDIVEMADKLFPNPMFGRSNPQ